MHDHQRPARAGKAARFAGAAAISIIAVLAAGGTTNAQPEPHARIAEDTQTFRIPSQPLAAALIAVARQADLLLVAPRELVAGKTAPALDGDYTPAEAFARLLDGSGIAFEITGDGRLLLRAESNGAESDEAGSDGALPPIDEVQRAERSQPAAEHEEPEQLAETDEGELAELEEIVVTGSNIRGAEPVGSKLITLDREAIERTGFSTVQDVVQSLPQNFGGGPNALTATLQGVENGANFAGRNFGASINLRGLGAGSTLTVLNGRRVAGAGGGAFVDVSTIPLSAVERIEVLPDGASAIYGTDAIAGVTNIILRKDYEGLETRLRFGSVTDGGQREFKASALLGTTWDTGNALISYEYQNIDPLFSEERNFAASSDLRPFGGADFRRSFSNPGTILAGGQSFAIPKGQDGTSLNPGDLIQGEVNLGNERSETTLLPSQERHSVFTSFRQDAASWLRFFAEGLYTHRKFESRSPAQALTLTVPSTNPFFVDPVGGLSTIQVNYSFIEDLGPQINSGNVDSLALASGFTADIISDWQLDFFGTFNRFYQEGGDKTGLVNRPALALALADPDPSTALNPFGDGSNSNPETLRRIDGFLIVKSGFELWSLDARIDGTLFRLPGGPVKLALGGHFREEDFLSRFRDGELLTDPTFETATDRGRHIAAGFAELNVPFVTPNNAFPGIERFEVSAAVRLEDYNDFGTTGNPRVGASWSPISGVDIRGTYGTSFRAPLLSLTNTSLNGIFFFPIPDPKSPSGIANAILLTGNDPDLGPENARSWTVGIDLEPAAMAGIRLSATYFTTRFRDRIGRVTDIGLLAREDVFAPLIMRNPDLATAEMFLAEPRLVNVVGSTDPNDVDVIVNATQTNLARTIIRGLDLTGRYDLETAIGRFSLSVNAGVLFDFNEAVTSTAPLTDLVDTLDRPVDWRMRNSLSWNRDGLSATVFLNYTDNYTNRNIEPAEPVSSWTTADLTLAYRTGDETASKWLQGLRLALSAVNLTDEKPPFVNNPRGVGFDPEKANPQGRFIAIEITKAW